MNSHPTNLKAFILEALSEALQIALAEAKAERQKAVASTAMSPQLPTPWYKAAVLSVRKIAK